MPLLKPPPLISRRNSVSTQSSISSASHSVEDLVSFDSPPCASSEENPSSSENRSVGCYTKDF